MSLRASSWWCSWVDAPSPRSQPCASWAGREVRATGLGSPGDGTVLGEALPPSTSPGSPTGYRFIFLTTAVTNSARLMEAMSELKG